MSPLFQPLTGRLLLGAGGATSTVTSAALLEPADTLAAVTLAVATVSSAALTEANDTLAAVAKAVGTVTSAALTEAADTLSADADAVARVTSAALTEPADTLASVAQALAQASAGLTEAPDTLAAVAVTVQTATVTSAALTEAPDVLAAVSGAVATAAAALTEPGDTLAATALAIAGALAPVSEVPDTLAATATVLVQAFAACTEADDVLQAEALGEPIEPGETLPGTGGAAGGDAHYHKFRHEKRKIPRNFEPKSSSLDGSALRQRLLREFRDEEARKAALARLPSIKERQRLATRAAARAIVADPAPTIESIEAEIEQALGEMYVQPTEAHLEWTLYYLRVAATRLAEMEDEDEALALLL